MSRGEIANVGKLGWGSGRGIKVTKKTRRGAQPSFFVFYFLLEIETK
jgi:hypothetical protein